MKRDARKIGMFPMYVIKENFNLFIMFLCGESTSNSRVTLPPPAPINASNALIYQSDMLWKVIHPIHE